MSAASAGEAEARMYVAGRQVFRDQLVAACGLRDGSMIYFEIPHPSPSPHPPRRSAARDADARSVRRQPAVGEQHISSSSSSSSSASSLRVTSQSPARQRASERAREICPSPSSCVSSSSSSSASSPSSSPRTLGSSQCSSSEHKNAGHPPMVPEVHAGAAEEQWPEDAQRGEHENAETMGDRGMVDEEDAGVQQQLDPQPCEDANKPCEDATKSYEHTNKSASETTGKRRVASGEDAGVQQQQSLQQHEHTSTPALPTDNILTPLSPRPFTLAPHTNPGTHAHSTLSDTHIHTHTHTQHTPSPAPTSSPPLSTPLARRGHPAGATSPHNSTPTYISTPSEYYPLEDPEDEMAR